MTIHQAVERARATFEHDGIEGLSELAESEEYRVAMVQRNRDFG